MKPKIAWAVVTPDGHILRDTIRRLRSDSIKTMTEDSISWNYWRGCGYRVAKVAVEELQ
jgi:hypothetical protein